MEHFSVCPWLREYVAGLGGRKETFAAIDEGQGGQQRSLQMSLHELTSMLNNIDDDWAKTLEALCSKHSQSSTDKGVSNIASTETTVMSKRIF